MGQLIVQHYRGLKEYYNIVSHGQGIYFATDTKEIILNGNSYSGEGSEAFKNLKLEVDANTASLLVLNGTGEGSVVKIVNDAINDFATKISDDGTVNTFKELVDYAATHSTEIIELVGEINAVKEKDNEQDARIEALELIIGGGEEGVPSIIETLNTHTEYIVTLQSDIVEVKNDINTNTSYIENLQGLVGDKSVAQQIDEALEWEDVE